MFRTVFTVLVMAAGSMNLAALAQDQAPPKELVQEQTPPKELIQYVRDARKAGQNDSQIQQNAVNSGWPLLTVNEAIAYVREKDAPAASPAATPAPAEKKDPSSSPDKPETPPANGTPPGPATSPTAGAPAEPAKSAGNAKPPETTVTKPATPNRGVPDEYQIGVGDVLDVNVWKEPDASVHGAVVRTDEKISMPLLKEVSVVGLTPIQLEKLITERLADLINSPDVTIVITGTGSKKIYLTGNVKKEGAMPYTYRMRVMQALLEAGGLTPYAKKNKIYIMRTENGKQFRLPFDYVAVLNGQHLELNIELMPGDMIVVP